MKRFICLMALAVSIGGFSPQELRADTYHQLKACLRNCIETTEPGSKARLICVADCYAAWLDQKLSINIDVLSSSTGYRVVHGDRFMVVSAGSQVTANFNITSGDVLNSIQLILVDDSHNPADPAFGIVVGSDNNGGDGWSITFDSAPFGNFSGTLVARAQFAGHNEETDGDQSVIYIGTAAPVPAASRRSLIVLTLLLLTAGTAALGWSRRARPSAA